MTLHGMAPETGSLCYTVCEALRRHREVPLPGIAVTVDRSGTGSFFPRTSEDPQNRSNHSLNVLPGKLSLSPHFAVNGYGIASAGVLLKSALTSFLKLGIPA